MDLEPRVPPRFKASNDALKKGRKDKPYVILIGEHGYFFYNPPRKQYYATLQGAEQAFEKMIRDGESWGAKYKNPSLELSCNGKLICSAVFVQDIGQYVKCIDATIDHSTIQ